MEKETIAAIATAPGNAGIGIVRISGEDAICVADSVYQSKYGKKSLKEVPSHTMHFGFVIDKDNKDEIIDEVLISVFRAPKSYTGENTAEINCHGGDYVTRRVLELVVKAGARPAEPGEFTKRAFLNGRLDLSQAEAVMDVIEAENEYALKSSLRQLQGGVYEKVSAMRERLIYHIAYIESALDDPEHIVLKDYGKTLLPVIDDMTAEIEELLKRSIDGKIIKEGIRTVIVGKPNAGKSSLLNALTGEDKAIVTDIAGTTRDIIEESVSIQGIPFNLADTAGIRDTEDRVEKIGVDRAKSYVRDADLIIYVVDSSIPLDNSDKEIMNLIKDKKSIVLLNKSDLEQRVTKEELELKLSVPIFSISAFEKKGIEDFKNFAASLFFDGEIDFNSEVLLTNMRHKSAMEETLKSLLLVKQSILNGMPEDFYSIDLMDAYQMLGRIIGEQVEDDLVNEIFGKFCMGK